MLRQALSGVIRSAHGYAVLHQQPIMDYVWHRAVPILGFLLTECEGFNLPGVGQSSNPSDEEGSCRGGKG